MNWFRMSDAAKKSAPTSHTVFQYTVTGKLFFFPYFFPTNSLIKALQSDLEEEASIAKEAYDGGIIISLRPINAPRR